MKGQQKTAWKAVAVLLASAAMAWAQSSSLSGSENSPVPAGPGTVNYVEGEVLLNGQNLSRDSVGSAVLHPGETLETHNGYVELLLTPGTFLRVGHDSQVQLPTAGLAGAQVQLRQGSAMLEVDQLINGTNLAIQMNGTSAQVEKQGLYSFDAANQTIQTFDGKLKVTQDGKSVELGRHDELQLASDKPLKKHSFNEDQAKVEPLYVWSKARSADEAQASLRSSQNAEAYVAAGPGWYWDPYFEAYGFWPLAGSLYSPFGWGFYSPAYFGYYGFYGPAWNYYRYPGRYYGHNWKGRPGGTAARVIPRRGASHVAAPRFSAPTHFSAPSHFSMPAPHFSAPHR
ncbi:MAG TPA: hypothetical protein VKX25_11280 [Bryobacteraceae bacterium]|jgi:hypothetical protein|nr:hypothetical protein [Bryobacteraceae bacterium]